MKDNYSAFLELDLTEYAGEWVAICDGEVVSHDQSFKKAFETAKRECQGKSPLMAMIPTEDALIF